MGRITASHFCAFFLVHYNDIIIFNDFAHLIHIYSCNFNRDMDDFKIIFSNYLLFEHLTTKVFNVGTELTRITSK